MASNVTTLLNSSYDSFSNLYSVSINPVPSGVSAFSGDLRIAGFKPPELSLGEYETHYKTVSLPRFNAQIVGDREFSLKFRINSDYSLYDNLKRWKNLFVKLSTDSVNFGIHNSNTPLTSYGTVTVKALKSSTSGLQADGSTTSPVTWVFKQVVLYDLIEPVYSREGSTPVEVTAKFMFGEFTPPTEAEILTSLGVV